MTYTPTPSEIEAGAEALAGIYFINGMAQWPLSKFPDSQQEDFRVKARAVLEAAAGVREVANG